MMVRVKLLCPGIGPPAHDMNTLQAEMGLQTLGILVSQTPGGYHDLAKIAGD
jgi:hypothetical protein